jgi:hypothetical protein
VGDEHVGLERGIGSARLKQTGKTGTREMGGRKGKRQEGFKVYTLRGEEGVTLETWVICQPLLTKIWKQCSYYLPSEFSRVVPGEAAPMFGFCFVVFSTC